MSDNEVVVKVVGGLLLLYALFLLAPGVPTVWVLAGYCASYALIALWLRRRGL